MRTLRNKRYEVTTDGRTVWVNGPLCIGRFCPVSAEVLRVDGTMLYKSPPAWTWWLQMMRWEHGVMVPDDFKPKWLEEKERDARWLRSSNQPDVLPGQDPPPTCS